ncbi:MAG: hypothetical protein BWX66_02110 [Deltaproteobacteria bacterium ADurb.Bin058]|nr:MAG: hypothetical protein BWX66_02110 [Deltaproteobacteria bacterium ADurb.Bin058]
MEIAGFCAPSKAETEAKVSMSLDNASSTFSGFSPLYAAKPSAMATMTPIPAKTDAFLGCLAGGESGSSAFVGAICKV